MNPKSTDQELIVISSYPEKGQTHGKGTVGVASYAKNTLNAISNDDKNIAVTVLAEKLPDSESDYMEGQIRVKRIWKRGSMSLFWNLFSEIVNNHKHTKIVMIELELAMFGGAIALLPLPLFLVLLKTLGKKTTLVIHQVIPDMEKMAGHINLQKGSSLLKLYSFCIQMLYRAVLLLSTKVIVFDEVLKSELNRFGNPQKIEVIPHGIEEFANIPSADEARKKLDIKPEQFVVLSFGFLAWYKGTDWLVEAIEKIENKNIQLILAGGPNPNHMDKDFYKKYIAEIEKTCAEKGFVVTGFVTESDIPFYFQASDLVVLPYRTMMSASGPLSLALSFKKPFLVSSAMEGVFETKDIKEKISEFKINKTDLYFQNADDLSNKISGMQKDTTQLKKISTLSESLFLTRSWIVIGKMYKDILFN